MKTYPCGDYEQVWDSLFETIDLFEQVALEVASILGYHYPIEDASKVRQYLKEIKLNI